MRNVVLTLEGQWWILVLGSIVLVGIFILWKGAHWLWPDRWTRVLDGVFIFLLLLFPFRPGLLFQQAETEQPIIVILRDYSLSSRSTSSLESLYRNMDNNPIWKQWEGQGIRVLRRSFGLGLQQRVLQENDSLSADTRLAESLEKLRLELGPALGAVILVSDGHFRLPTAASNHLPPVYPLVPPQDSNPNRALRDIEAPSGLQVGVPAPIRVSVADSKGGARVTLYVDGRPLAGRTTRGGNEEMVFRYTPQRTGWQVLSARIETGAGEPFLADDQIDRVFRVAVDKVTVLLTWGLPEPEIRFLTRLLRSLGTYRLVRMPLKQVVAKQQALKTARVILLVSPTPDQPNQVTAAILRKLVAGGCGLVLVRGENGRFNPNLAGLVPYQGRGVLRRGSFQWTLTGEGRTSGLGLPASGSGSETLAPFRYYLAGVEKKAKARVLAHIEGTPVLLRQQVGQGRVYSLSAGPSWSWDFVNHAYGIRSDHFDRFWGGLVEELALARGDSLRLEPERNVTLPGQPVQVRVYGPLARLSRSGYVECRFLFDADRSYRFPVQPGRAGYGVARVAVPRFGAYRLKLGKGETGPTARLLVRAVEREYRSTPVDQERLRLLARRSGGKMLERASAFNVGRLRPRRRYTEKQLYLMENWFMVIGTVLIFVLSVYLRWRKSV